MKKFVKPLLIVGLFAIGGLLTATSQGQSKQKMDFQTKGHTKSRPLGYWQTLDNPPPFVSFGNPGGPAPGGAGLPLLMTDGTILVQNSGFALDDQGELSSFLTNEIWKLTPNAFGSYVKGTWSQLASLPDNYIPTSGASAVLADGRVILQGGEDTGSNYDFGLTNMGAIYDPVANVWTPLAPPPFFIDQYPPRALWAPNLIGDAACIVLPDGTYMIQNKLGTQAALLDLSTMTWRETGTATKLHWNDETFLNLLPNGKVLTVDCYTESTFLPDLYSYPADPTSSEIYDPATETWSYAGSTIVPLTDPYNEEQGACVLRPDGKLVAFSGNTLGKCAVYDSLKEKWSVGPTLPFVAGQGQLSCADEPAAILRNGNILVSATPYVPAQVAGIYELPPIHFYELTFDTMEFIEQPTVPNFEIDGSGYMVVLPTGQIMFTDNSLDVEIYTPGDDSYNPAWAPEVRKAPKRVSAGQTYKISGIRFNGMSQGASFNDEFQTATNYPLVRITNNNTGHVFYCRTHDHSSMAVASSKKVFTFFDVPAGIETGKSTLEVVANGIPSAPVSIVVN